MIIAVDFDGTLVEHKYPYIGNEIPFAFDALKQLQNENHILILWTVREGNLLQEAIDYCSKKGVTFFAHNSNFPEEDKALAPRKLKADLFIDDRNFGGLPDWPLICKLVKERNIFNLTFQTGNELIQLPKKKSIWNLFR